MGAPRALMREERKFVTALFADVVGSTALAETMDPEDVRDLLGGAIERIVHAVEDLGGTVKDLAGDGVLALFGAPAVHEDDPERAVRSGLRITETIAEYARDVAATVGIAPLSVRVGIESGVVVLGPVGAGARIEYGATGDAVNTAARLQAHARPGTVLVGWQTQRLIPTRVEWGQPQQLRLKGKVEPVTTYQALRALDRPVDVRATIGTALVGRDTELQLIRSVADAVVGGDGRVLLVIGEPGIGKSRLLSEVRSRIEAIGGKWLEGHCLSLGASTPYLPFNELLRGWLELGSNPTDAVAAKRITAQINHALGTRASDARPFLAALVGAPLTREDSTLPESISPEARHFRTAEALSSLLSAMAEASPHAIAIEDLHWADASSIQVLSELLPLARSVPLLIAMSSREEPGPWSDVVASAAPGGFVVVHLDTLPPGADRELVSSLTGRSPLPKDLEWQILEAGGGNPFYLEELVRSLADAGALAGETHARHGNHVVQVEVPNTIERVIVSRIDRLPDAPRDVLTAASVVGRSFSVGLLERVATEIADVAGPVDELVRLDLLRTTEELRRLYVQTRTDPGGRVLNSA